MRELKPKPKTNSEFSRFAILRELPKNGAWFILSPKPEERTKLAERLMIQELGEFSVKAQLVELPGDHLWRLTAEVQARFVQTCVLTLGPAHGRLNFTFEELFTDRQPRKGEEDPPELIDDGGIDIGEVATQHLSLNLPDFPRAEGVSLDDVLAAKYREEE